jgi:hypothetical protein
VESYPRVPTLFLNASTFDMLWPGWGRKVLARWITRSRTAGVDVRALHVKGSKHQNFADFCALIPEVSQTLGFAGETPPATINKILVQCDHAFLCHHLGVTPLAEPTAAATASGTGDATDPAGAGVTAPITPNAEGGSGILGWTGGAHKSASWIQQLGASVGASIGLGVGVEGKQGDSVTNGWEPPAGLDGVELDKCHTLPVPAAPIAVSSPPPWQMRRKIDLCLRAPMSGSWRETVDGERARVEGGRAASEQVELTTGWALYLPTVAKEPGRGISQDLATLPGRRAISSKCKLCNP